MKLIDALCISDMKMLPVLNYKIKSEKVDLVIYGWPTWEGR